MSQNTLTIPSVKQTAQQSQVPSFQQSRRQSQFQQPVLSPSSSSQELQYKPRVGENPLDVNPFRYLYRMKYKNPTLPQVPVRSDQQPQLQSQKDFFQKKFDEYMSTSNLPLAKTMNAFSATNLLNHSTKSKENLTATFKSKSQIRDLKQLKAEGSMTERSSLKSQINLNTQSINLSKLGQTREMKHQSQEFFKTWKDRGGSGFYSQRSQSHVKIEQITNQAYSNWHEAEQQLQNNKQFYDSVVNDMTEFQTQEFSTTLQDFKSYVGKIQGMPIIRVSKKKLLPEEEEKQANASNFEIKHKLASNAPKTNQQKQIFYSSSMFNQDLKLYWEKIPSMKWSPDSREGASMTCVGTKIYLFGGLSSKLNKDVEILNNQTWRWLKPQEFKVKHSPSPRFNHSAVLYFDHVIIFGGQQNYNSQTKIRNTNNDLLLFNTQTYEWEQIHYGGMFFHRKLHSAAIVAHHMILYGGQNEEGQFEGGLLALNLGTFKWMPCPIQGEDPGKLIYQACCSVIHQERTSKKSFSLFKNPSDMKYRQFSRIKHEGVYFFGGRRPDGFSTNSLHILKVGTKPLQWSQPETKGQSPPPRYAHNLHYFEPMNSLVLFGGRNDTLMERKMKPKENFLNDLWLLNLENLTWCYVTSIGEVPNPSYCFSSAISGSRLVIFGGLNSKTYNNSDLYICELDPMLSKQYEAEKNRKILEFKKELARNKFGGDEAQSQTAQILQKFFGHRLKNHKMPLPLNLITYLENRHQAIERQKLEEKRTLSIQRSITNLANKNSSPTTRKTSEQFQQIVTVSRIDEDQEEYSQKNKDNQDENEMKDEDSVIDDLDPENFEKILDKQQVDNYKMDSFEDSFDESIHIAPN